MKASLVAIVIQFVVMCSVLPAQGEEAGESEKTDAPSTRVGLGVSLVQNVLMNDANEYVLSPIGLHGISQIYLLVDYGSVRFEPEFALIRSASEQGDWEASITAIRFGAGLLFVSKLGESTRSYFGIRGAVVRTATTSKYSSGEHEKESKIDIYVGPNIGGEYLLGEHFTIGVEAGFDYGRIGNFNNDSDRKTSLMSTRTQIIVRFYP